MYKYNTEVALVSCPIMVLVLQWTVVKKGSSRVEVSRQVYQQIRYVYRKIQRVKTWKLLLILILVGFVAATFLRMNNTGMDQRRRAVLAADSEGKDSDVLDRMSDLQHYVASHMNTSTGQFYLEEQYNRDKQRAIEAAVNDRNPNGNVNAQAEAVCRERFPNYQAGTYLQYQQCFIDEISKFPSAPNLDTEANLPNPALYRHSFAAPRWSPDFAGFSVLLFIAIALIILGRALRLGFLYLLLKLRQKGISS